MNKKTKIISGIGAISTLATITDFFFCRTLFNQTLHRAKIKKREGFENPEQHMSAVQITNRHREYLHYKRWIETVKVEKLSIHNHKGIQLIANMYPNHERSHKWVILLHGYMDEKESMRLHARWFHEEGYHVLAPDLQSHGESDGEYITLGWFERLDTKEWIQSILRLDSEAEIVIYGTSMGATTAMMCAGEDLPSNVKCIVEDSGYTSAYDILAHLITHIYKIPAFPIIHSLHLLIRQRLGFSIKKASALKQLSKTSLPVMFIHGKDDTFVPTKMALQLYESCPSEKRLYIIENCKHTITMLANPNEYFAHIFDFINQYIKDEKNRT